MTADTIPTQAEPEDEIIVYIGGEEIRVNRAAARTLANSLRNGPEGSGISAIFDAMASLPGSELGPARELEPTGPDDVPPLPEDSAPTTNT